MNGHLKLLKCLFRALQMFLYSYNFDIEIKFNFMPKEDWCGEH